MNTNILHVENKSGKKNVMRQRQWHNWGKRKLSKYGDETYFPQEETKRTEKTKVINNLPRDTKWRTKTTVTNTWNKTTPQNPKGYHES